MQKIIVNIGASLTLITEMGHGTMGVHFKFESAFSFFLISHYFSIYLSISLSISLSLSLSRYFSLCLSLSLCLCLSIYISFSPSFFNSIQLLPQVPFTGAGDNLKAIFNKNIALSKDVMCNPESYQPPKRFLICLLLLADKLSGPVSVPEVLFSRMFLKLYFWFLNNYI